MDKNQTISLVEKAQSGDKKAFEELYKEYGKVVYFNCLKLTGNEHTAQDILQDTFLTALQKINDLKFPENFSAWIIRIAVNKCKMSFRSAVPQTDDGDEIFEEFKDDGMIPDDFVDSEEKRKIIMNIIDNILTVEQRQTIILYYYDSMSVAEISRIMDCPVGSVTSRLSASRQKIREAVLIYEKENDDRLHAVIPIPILTQIFNKEAEKLTLPKLTISANMNAENSQTNSDSRFDNSVQKTHVKSGGKIMLKSVKVKIISGVIAAAIVAGGVTTAVVVNNNKDSKVEKDSGTSSKSQKNSSSATEEEGVKFWITQQNFTSAPLTKLPEDFTVLDSKISMPLSYDKLDQYYQSCSKSTNEMYGMPYKEVFEKINLSGHEAGSYRKEYTDYLYAKGMTNGFDDDHPSTYGDLYVYNYSNNNMTANDCFENDWWELGYTCPNGEGRAYRFMGLTKEELGQSDKAGEEALNQLVDKLGTPTYFSPLLTDKDPQEVEKEQFTESLAMLTYVLAWEYDDYVVSVDVTEIINDHKDNLSFNGMSIMPKEAWTKKYEHNKEVNEKDGRTIYFEYNNKIDTISDGSVPAQTEDDGNNDDIDIDNDSSSDSDSSNEDVSENNVLSKDQEEWILKTSLDINQPANLCRAVLSGSAYVGNALATTTYNRNYWNDTYPNVKLNEAGLKFLGDKCKYKGETIKVSDKLKDRNKNPVYARIDNKNILFNKFPIFNVDGNLLVSLNAAHKTNSAISYSTYGYTPTKFHIYDKNGKELKSYDIKYQSCYQGFYVFEDLPTDAAAYSFDFEDSYDGLEGGGFTDYVQHYIENNEDINILFINLGSSDILNLTRFGADDDVLEDDCANPYVDDLDKAHRYMIFRRKDQEKIKCHLTLAGFTLNKDGTLSDMEKKTFSLDENTDYTADLISENKIWFFINE